MSSGEHGGQRESGPAIQSGQASYYKSVRLFTDPSDKEGEIMATTSIHVHFKPLGRRWGWFLVLGILLIALGIAALAFTPAATLASVLILGWLMFFSGIVEAVHAFHARGWGGVLLHRRRRRARDPGGAVGRD